MLVSFSVKNLFSFKDTQTLRMDAVSHGRDDIVLDNVFSGPATQEQRLLESALLFGANASGKSNFLKALMVLRSIVLNSQATLDDSQSPLRRAIPYLLSKTTMQQPSVLEVEFFQQGIKYRYGLEISADQIHGEWLFYTPSARETLLFNREGQHIEHNKSGFPEAGHFIKEGKVQQTRPNVPFVSVLATNNGHHSLQAIQWFNQLRMASGVEELGYMGFTLELLKNNPDFKKLALKLLREFGIHDLNVVEIDIPDINIGNANPELKNVLSAVSQLSKNKKQTQLTVIKRVEDSDDSYNIEFPLEFESEGTRKLIHLLGPLYDAIQHKRVLLIDEIEAKFHSLLTRFVFSTYHAHNTSGSQIIATAHDTNLMDTRFFRRDQIWFVDKQAEHGSQLYSLIEFKEKARQLKENYGPDYLKGAFGAVSLFENLNQIEEIMTDG